MSLRLHLTSVAAAGLVVLGGGAVSTGPSPPEPPSADGGAAPSAGWSAPEPSSADGGAAPVAGASPPEATSADGGAAPATGWSDGPPSSAAGMVEGPAGARGSSPAVVPERVPGAGGRASAPALTAGDVGRWRWPLTPRPVVLRRFRAPPDPYAAGHRGLDLATSIGSPVLAVEGGVVTHRGWVAGRQTVTVEHHDGLRSTYEPVTPSVAVGDVVRTGQRLGVVAAATGSAAGHCGARACLHLGARRADGYVDPWPLLTGGRIVLLPLR